MCEWEGLDVNGFLWDPQCVNEEANRAALGRLVKRDRLRIHKTVDKARASVGISRGAWDNVEAGRSVKEVTLASVEDALGWPTGRAARILSGEEPVNLRNDPGAGRRSAIQREAEPLEATVSDTVRSSFESAILRALADDPALVDLLAERVVKSLADKPDFFWSHPVEVVKELMSKGLLSEGPATPNLALAADPDDDAAGESESYNEP